MPTSNKLNCPTGADQPKATYQTWVKWSIDVGWIPGIALEIFALLFLSTDAIYAPFYFSILAFACFWLSWYAIAVADHIDELAEQQRSHNQ